jgi:L-2-hydroxyglutarate oxidase LhgO
VTEHVRCIVVGAGVVGLAVARELALATSEVLVLEREAEFGSATSSRNSEVIHGGMYYPPGTLKARACVAGRRLLYDYCRDRGVGHARVGKLIVATEPAHLDALRTIAARAEANGLTTPADALHWLDADAVHALEPELRCLAALHSPDTGIVDTHGLMLALLGDAEHAGAMLSLRTARVDARRDGERWRVRTRGPDGEFELTCDALVNAAGLQAQRVAATIAGVAPDQVPPALWLKGNYFTVQGRQPPFKRLVYPVPSGGGLGVHLTLDLGGQARFGPDTEPVDPAQLRDDAPDYRVDPARAAVFYAEIRRYWPGLPDGALQAAYAGMRPKLAAGGVGLDANDFDVRGPARGGPPGLVQLFGIESPGITASLALAARVAAELGLNDRAV